MWGLPQKQNARRADKIRLCGHLRRYKKIVKKTNIIKVKEYIMEINKMTYSHLNLDIVLELNDIDSVDKEYVAYSETVRGFGNMYPKIYFSSDEKIIITKVK